MTKQAKTGIPKPSGKTWARIAYEFRERAERAEKERDEARAEVAQLREALEARDEGLIEVAAACRAVAERQREACVASMLKSVDGCGCLPCREQAVRDTPLVTTPASGEAREALRVALGEPKDVP